MLYFGLLDGESYLVLLERGKREEAKSEEKGIARIGSRL
jgi:hypothetical protein